MPPARDDYYPRDGVRIGRNDGWHLRVAEREEEEEEEEEEDSGPQRRPCAPTDAHAFGLPVRQA
eukprot:176214-Pyramimonas_sp.AAC.1